MNLNSESLQQVLHDIARAPSVNMNRMTAMYQLDFAGAKSPDFAKLDDLGHLLLSLN